MATDLLHGLSHVLVLITRATSTLAQLRPSRAHLRVQSPYWPSQQLSSKGAVRPCPPDSAALLFATRVGPRPRGLRPSDRPTRA